MVIEAHGYEPTGYETEDTTAQGYQAPTAAPVVSYDATKQGVTSDQLSVDQLNKMLDSDSPYIKQARNDGLLASHQRGMLNSSMSAGAATAAATRAAAPFAMQDANTFASAEANYANAQNRASEFGAREQNVAMLQENQQQDAANRFGAAESNVADRANTLAANQASEYGASAINRAGEFYAGAQNTASITHANNELTLALQDARDEISAYATDVQRKTALDHLGLNLFNTAMSSGVFNNAETISGYFNTVSGLFPELGIEIIGQTTYQVPEGVVI